MKTLCVGKSILLLSLLGLLGLFFACEMSYPDSNYEPYLVSPRNEAEGVSINKTLVWNCKFLPNTFAKEDICYTLYLVPEKETISNELVKVKPYINQPLTGEHWLQLSNLEPNTKYLWWVTAIGQKTDPDGSILSEFNQTVRSKTFSFTTGPSDCTQLDSRHFLVVIASTVYERPKGPNPFANLTNTYNDAKDVIAAFQKLNEPYKIIARYANEASGVRITKKDFDSAFEELKKYNPQPEDLIVFFYSGHGGAYDGNSFLVMGDTPQDDIISTNEAGMKEVNWKLLYNSAENVTGKWLKAKFDLFPAQKLMLMDCCNSGQFIDLNKANLASTVSQGLSQSEGEVSEFAINFISDFIQTVSNPENDKVVVAATKPAEVPQTSDKYHIITSTTVDTNSWESHELQNGLFTYAFLDGIGGSNNPISTCFDFTFDADQFVPYNAITFNELGFYSRMRVNQLRKGQKPKQKVLYYSQTPSFVFTNYFN